MFGILFLLSFGVSAKSSKTKTKDPKPRKHYRHGIDHDFHDLEHTRVMREDFNKKLDVIKAKENATKEEQKQLLQTRKAAEDSKKVFTELENRVFHDEERRLEDQMAKLKDEYRKLYKDELEKRDPDFHERFMRRHRFHKGKHEERIHERRRERKRDFGRR
jgi:hypothetical protein